MTPSEAIARVNDDHRSTQALQELIGSPWIRLAFTGFFVGVAWSDLHATIRENKMEADTRFAVMATDLHVLKVLGCKAYPNDSVCAVTP